MKEGHVAATVSGPAHGKLGPILWTFKGVENAKDLASGAPNSYWQKTHNGWPDQSTLRHWGKLMIKTKNERALEKMLIFVDNAAIHCDLELCAELAANKIVLLGLVPSSTSKTQPLDKAFFGSIKAKFPGMASKKGLVRSYATVATIFEMCLDEMDASAFKAGSSVLASGFRQTGLWPWNPKIHGDESFAPSDLRLGIKAGDEAVKKAAERGKAASIDLIQAVIDAEQPEGVQKLQALADAKRAARLAVAAGTGTTAEGPIDGAGFVKRALYTSVSFHEEVSKKAAAEEAAKKAAKLAAVARSASAAARRAEKVARSDAFKAKTAASKLKKEAEIAAKALKAAEMAAKKAAPPPQIPPPPANVGKKRARAPSPDDDPYARAFAKRAR